MNPPRPLEKMCIISKRDGLLWEADGVTNPGIVRLADNTIAMVYRGCGGDGNGYLGFCRLNPEGHSVIQGSRSEQPLNIPFGLYGKEFPQGFGDPRINKVGNWYYIWANARNNEMLHKNRAQYDNDFSGQYIGGRQTTAFRTKDFIDVEYLGLHGPKEFDKNAFLHPEPVWIDGKSYWAMFHRIQYNIQVALASEIADYKNASLWDEHVSRLKDWVFVDPLYEWEGVDVSEQWPGSIAGGAPPIAIDTELTSKMFDSSEPHWLLFYNGSGAPRPGTVAKGRQIGALIYRVKTQPDVTHQPFEIVARSRCPILSPEEGYEKNSPNGDIVFATGAVMSPDKTTVDIFYGSGDVAISKARFNVSELVRYIAHFDENGRIRS